MIVLFVHLLHYSKIKGRKKEKTVEMIFFWPMFSLLVLHAFNSGKASIVKSLIQCSSFTNNAFIGGTLG
uniref:Uncharacterized protein n=1 Tax=Parascaris equorum TaxID=6256 RepID=A0A914RLV0_PAREQ